MMGKMNLFSYLVYNESGDGKDPETSATAAPTSGEDKKPVKVNQFSFSERAAQTVNNPYRVNKTNAGKIN